MPPSKGIPFSKGQKVPTRDQALKAIGKVTGDAARALQPPFGITKGRKEVFPPMPHPSSRDDWLAQYVEPGQSFSSFCKSTPWLGGCMSGGISKVFNGKGRTIPDRYPGGKVYILPIGDLSSLPFSINELSEFLEIYLGLPVATMPAVQLVELPDTEETISHPRKLKDAPVLENCVRMNLELDKPLSTLANGGNGRKRRRHSTRPLACRVHKPTGRRQIQVDGFLQMLGTEECLPNDALTVMAVTTEDLYDEYPDLFVAGMASSLGQAAIFSLRRYDPALELSYEWWYDYDVAVGFAEQMGKDYKRMYLHRAVRLLAHEQGHLLGIDHCIHYQCLMNGSGHLEEDFRQPLHLCPIDLHKIHRLCGVDLRERYVKLQRYYRKHGFKDELEFVTRRLDFINSTK